MKKIFVIFAIILLTISSSSAKMKFELAPEFGLMGGEAEYELDITDSFIDTSTVPFVGVTYRLTSLLEFPMDVLTGGVTFRLNSEEDPSRWSLDGSILSSFTNPGGRMYDTDWQGEIPYYPYTKWSYTESDAEMSMIQLDLDFAFRLKQSKKLTISALIGGRYQKSKFDVIGLQGWQIPFDSLAYNFADTIFYFSGYNNEKIGYYEVTFKQFKLGFLTNYKLSEKMQVDLKTIFTPLQFDDFDDHILRNKLSSADGDGNGFIGDVQFKYDFTRPGVRNNLFVQFGMSFVTIKATGPQTQTWDGDDGATPTIDDTGISISGIPHTVRTTQTRLNLRVGMQL